MFLRSETPFLILRQDPCRYSSTVRHNPKKFSCEWSLIFYPFKIRVKAQSRLEGHSPLFGQASHSELAQGCIRKATTEPSFQSKGAESLLLLHDITILSCFVLVPANCQPE